MEKIQLSNILAPVTNRVLSDGMNHFCLTAPLMKVKFPNYYVKAEDLPVAIVSNISEVITDFVLCFNIFTLKWVWCKASIELPVCLSPDIVAYKLINNKVSPEYLYYALNDTECVSLLLEEREMGRGAISSPNFLLSLEINIPATLNDEDYKSFEFQYISDVKDRLAEDKSKELELVAKSFQEDVKDKMHLVAPYASSIDRGLDKIIKILEKGSFIDYKTEIYRMPAIEYIKTLRQKFDYYNHVIGTLSEDYHGVVEPVNLLSFFSENRNTLIGEGVDFNFTLNCADSRLCALIGRQDFRYIVDTIIRNAKRHGFTDYTGEKCINVSCYKEKASQFVSIDIANSGSRVPQDFTYEMYISRGGKIGNNANTGRGGKWIYDSITFFEGKLEIVTDDPKWSFIVKLKLPFVYV